MLRQTYLAGAIISLCLLSHLATAKPAPAPGRKSAFGAGMLSGVLTGAVVGAVSNHHFHKQQQKQTQQPANSVTTIERGETLPNGCYKQIVKEPNPYDARQFMETVHLVCPPGVQAVSVAPAAPMQVVPVPQPANIGFVPAQVPVQQQVNVSTQPIQVNQQQPDQPAVITFNSPPPVLPATSQVHQQQAEQPAVITFNSPPPVLPVQVQQQQPQQQQPAVITFNSPPPILPVQVQQPQQPVVIAGSNPPQTPVNPQVYVLSKKHGFFSKSAASDVLKINFVLMLFMAMILIMFY